MKENKVRNKDRAASETTITFSISKNDKESLIKRAEASPEMTISRLIRLALHYHNVNDWKEVHGVASLHE